MAKISELLAQPTVTLAAGDYVAAITRSESFVPSFKDTRSFVNGRHLFKIVAGTGVGNVNVVPLELSADAKSYVEQEPIIVQTTGSVVFVTGRNDNEYKDGYQDRHYVTKTGIAAGQEHKEVLAAFVDFAMTEFGLGVNDFQVAGPEYLDMTV
jgi:hypothetical protein